MVLTDEAAKDLADAMRKLADAIERSRVYEPAIAYPAWPTIIPAPSLKPYGDAVPLDYREVYPTGPRTWI